MVEISLNTHNDSFPGQALPATEQRKKGKGIWKERSVTRNKNLQEKRLKEKETKKRKENGIMELEATIKANTSPSTNIIMLYPSALGILPQHRAFTSTPSPLPRNRR